MSIKRKEQVAKHFFNLLKFPYENVLFVFLSFNNIYYLVPLFFFANRILRNVFFKTSSIIIFSFYHSMYSFFTPKT